MAKKISKKETQEQVEGLSPSILKKISEVWKDGIQSKSAPELEQEIIHCVRSISQQTKDMKEDPKIQQLSEDLKLLKSGFSEIISEDKCKIEYLICLLNARGTPVDKSVVSLKVKQAEKE
jgi:hypothetical protein